MTTKASGAFAVSMNPQPAYNQDEGSLLGRMSLDKEFKGDLQAVSKGEMLTAGTAVEGSAGYVAIERVTGSLHGFSGAFTLQHSGTMDRGAPTLVLTVVPDSGTGELAGISGSMRIGFEEGGHVYVFEYELPA
ncbi:MAG TPA: DUF3224 domain-containing protein [Herpetosiphonaceae bacterium]